MSAIAIAGGRILSVGYNHLRRYSSYQWGTSIHAEEDVIANAPCSLHGAKILVYRFARSNHGLRTSKPCPLCQAKLRFNKISYTVYMDEDGMIKKKKF